MHGNNIIYFDRFRVLEYTKEVKKIIGNKNILKNNYTVQVYKSIMSRYFCIGFVDFMLKGKSLLDDRNLFSPNDHVKDDKIILKYFQ